MLILGVSPKQICVTTELSIEEISDLLDLFDRSVINYSEKEEPDFHKKVEWLKKVFIPTMDRIVEQYKDGA
jgi:hypothetical protein